MGVSKDSTVLRDDPFSCGFFWLEYAFIGLFFCGRSTGRRIVRSLGESTTGALAETDDNLVFFAFVYPACECLPPPIAETVEAFFAPPLKYCLWCVCASFCDMFVTMIRSKRQKLFEFISSFVCNEASIGRLCINEHAVLNWWGHILSPKGWVWTTDMLSLPPSKPNQNVWKSLHHFTTSITVNKLWITTQSTRKSWLDCLIPQQPSFKSRGTLYSGYIYCLTLPRWWNHWKVTRV